MTNQTEIHRTGELYFSGERVKCLQVFIDNIFTFAVIGLYILIIVAGIVILFEGFIRPQYSKGYTTLKYDVEGNNISPSGCARKKKKRMYKIALGIFVVLFIVLTAYILWLVIVKSESKHKDLKIQLPEKLPEKKDITISVEYKKSLDTLLSRNMRNPLPVYKDVKLDKYFPNEYKNCILTKDSIILIINSLTGLRSVVPITTETLMLLNMKAQDPEFTALIESHPLYVKVEQYFIKH